MKRIASICSVVGMVLISVTILLSVAGCGEIRTEDAGLNFRKVVVLKGITHFTFEYPASYQITPELHAGFDEETYIYLGRLFPGGYRAEITFHLRALKVSKDVPNAAYLEGFSYNLSTGLPEFKFLERTESRIGEKVVFQTVFSWVQTQLDGKPVSTIDRRVFFDHDGVIFSLAMVADEALSDEAEADFEHILETFKLLD